MAGTKWIAPGYVILLQRIETCRGDEESVANPSVAIVGAGIGGLACAIALRQAGVEVTVFEQAPAFGRIGAAINLTPNAVKVLDRFGLAVKVRAKSHTASYRISRTWDTGEETSRIEMGRSAEERYGVSPLMLHRADLMSTLEDAIPADAVRFGKKLTRLRQDAEGVELTFQDGTTHRAAGVIGADGIQSVVKEQQFGQEAPVFTGMSAYRTIIPARDVADYDCVNFVKWWGPVQESQIVTNAIDNGNYLFLFATMPEPETVEESWSMEGGLAQLQGYYAGYHSEARAVIDASGGLLRTALYERTPLKNWTEGRVTLLGDACHAMVPFMAQGAAMGLEDAAILSRCAESGNDWPEIFSRYEKSRKPRADMIQLNSHKNEWLKNPENPDWVYGYDVWTAELAA